MGWRPRTHVTTHHMAMGDRTPRVAQRRGMCHLTHVDGSGRAAMVGVGGKEDTVRVAEAEGIIIIGSTAFQLVEANQLKKGDVLTVSQLAGVMGVKATSSLIPLCHPLLLTNISLTLTLDREVQGVRVRSR